MTLCSWKETLFVDVRVSFGDTKEEQAFRLNLNTVNPFIFSWDGTKVYAYFYMIIILCLLCSCTATCRTDRPLMGISLDRSIIFIFGCQNI